MGTTEMLTITDIQRKSKLLLNERQRIDYIIATSPLFEAAWEAANQLERTELIQTKLSKSELNDWLNKMSYKLIDRLSKSRLIQMAKHYKIPDYSRMDIDTLRINITLAIGENSETLTK